MSHYKHIPRKERFVSFGFQQSLRKYQPPVRKFTKPQKHKCNHCKEKDKNQIQRERLARLCETRKKYQITSREQASEYSKKKQKHLDNSQANRQNSVSDFDCSDPGSTFMQWQNAQQCIAPQIAKREKQDEMDQMFERISSETPIKEQIRNNLRMEEEQIYREMQMMEQQNRKKTKDIDFHIGMVQQIHDEFLKEYSDNLKSPAKNLPLRFEGNMSLFSSFGKSEKQLSIFSKKLACREQIGQSHQDYSEISHGLNQEKEETPEQQISSMFIRSFQRINLNQSLANESEEDVQEEIIEKQNITGYRDKSRAYRGLSREKKMLNLCQVSLLNGRIRIEGEKGPCYLSKRNLLKLFSHRSLTEVTQKVKNIHPYLNNTSEALQEFLYPKFSAGEQN